MSGINPPELGQALQQPDPPDDDQEAPDPESEAADKGIEHGSEADPDDR
jgi:hypothetical protein